MALLFRVRPNTLHQRFRRRPSRTSCETVLNNPDTPHPITRRQLRQRQVAIQERPSGRRALRVQSPPLTRRESLALERSLLDAIAPPPLPLSESAAQRTDLESTDPLSVTPSVNVERAIVLIESAAEIAAVIAPRHESAAEEVPPRVVAVPTRSVSSLSTVQARSAIRAQREPHEPTRPREKARRRGWRSGLALSIAAAMVGVTSLSAVGLTSSGPEQSSSFAASAAPQEFAMSAAQAGQVTRDGYSVAEPVNRPVAAAIRRTASTFSNNPTSAVQWPFPVGVPISDGFGPRESPGGIGSTNHKGVDFTPGEGSPISAIADGVVRLVQETDQGGLGVYVVIDHVIDGQQVSSWYGHMLSGSPLVQEGQAVVVGQQIGSVGNTGVSTGAHTHLEVHIGDTPVDPYAFIATRN